MDTESRFHVTTYNKIKEQVLLSQLQGRRKQGGGHMPPQFLADQSTLYQPGGQIMPTTFLPAPLKISDLPTALSCDMDQRI